MIFNALLCVNWWGEMCRSEKGNRWISWAIGPFFFFFLFKKCNWLTFWRIPENLLPSPKWLGGVLLSQPQRGYQGNVSFAVYWSQNVRSMWSMGTHLWTRPADSAEGPLGPQSSRFFKCMGSMFYTLTSLSTPRNGRQNIPKDPGIVLCSFLCLSHFSLDSLSRFLFCFV